MIGLSLYERTEAKKLPDAVRAYMRKRFMLGIRYIDSLRYFEHDGVVREKQVKRLYLFSPDSARRYGLRIRKAQELEQHPELLLFEGYIDRDEKIYLADRRTQVQQPENIQDRHTFFLLNALLFCAPRNLRSNPASHSKSSGADDADGETQGDSADTTNSAGEGETNSAEHDHTNSSTVPRKKIGSYGPGAGWPSTRAMPDAGDWTVFGEKRRNGGDAEGKSKERKGGPGAS